jgi:hypothetical protein
MPRAPRAPRTSVTKQSLERQKYTHLIETHDIEIEGPIPPRKWPARYRHIFQEIGEISQTRFDNYIKRNDINKNILEQRIKRAKEVVEKAVRLRKNISSNEQTWRGTIEITLVKVFDEQVVWLDSLTTYWSLKLILI